MTDTHDKPRVAIACGGTGGHLFPGLAVAAELVRRGGEVLLLISPKEVDQQAVKSVEGVSLATLPAIGLTRGRCLEFARGFWRSWRAARRLFRECPPQAVLAMGGFTSAPPILAGRACGAATYLHESNAVPGKANRWLAPLVSQVFVGFAAAARRLRSGKVETTGTPVRAEFRAGDPASFRAALGLSPDRPVLLVMGGSQGAGGINELMLRILPLVAERAPALQFVHLTGHRDFAKVRAAYEPYGGRAVVHAFLAETYLALGAATAAISRAGASSLAELAAMRVPAILIPYPLAADNHQYHNARLLAESGAAILLEQKAATPVVLAEQVLRLTLDAPVRAAMSEAMGRHHAPEAAQWIADRLLAGLRTTVRWRPSAASTADGKGPLQNPHSALA